MKSEVRLVVMKAAATWAGKRSTPAHTWLVLPVGDPTARTKAMSRVVLGVIFLFLDVSREQHAVGAVLETRSRWHDRWTCDFFRSKGGCTARRPECNFQASWPDPTALPCARQIAVCVAALQNSNLWEPASICASIPR